MTGHAIRAASFLSLVAWAAALGASPATVPADSRWADLPHTNTVFKPAEYKTLKEWQDRRAWLREQVRFAAGLIPEPERAPLNARVFDRRVYDGYTIEKVYFESYPGFYVTGNLYRPAKIEDKIPAVACPHGHWPQGRLHQDERGDIPARCITLARLGATVFAYDMIGYSDSKRQIEHRINTPERDLWGITSLHLQTWNSIRVLDFLQSLPEVDPERIGVTGASGGGTQTFILYAVDDRVKVAAPVNIISSTMQGGCVCENGPCLRIDTNNMEIGALMAPRPLLMISATGDWTKLTPEVEYPFIRSIYALYDAVDKVQNVHIDAPHNYNKASREAMYRFFARWLLKRDDADTITEGEIPKFRPEDLLVWTDETAPKNLLSIDQLTKQLQGAARARIAALRPDDPQKFSALRQLIQTSLVQAIAARQRTASDDRWRRERPHPGALEWSLIGRRLRGRYFGPGLDTRASGPLSITVDHADGHPIVSPFDARLAITPVSSEAGPQLGAASQPAGLPQFFTTFNRTEAAESVFELFALLPSEHSYRYRVPATLRAYGPWGPACLVARAMMSDLAVHKTGIRTVIDLNQFQMDSDEAYLKQLNIPHIRRIGGLQAIAAAACNGPIWFHNVGEHFDEEWVKAAGRVNGVEVRVTREKADEKAIVEWLME
ncbi:MAG TPA: acetylxylan esterase [Phycisphaerae bacterium]|nr:acetylxylan esterase [Phycisphaerae bacterium]